MESDKLVVAATVSGARSTCTKSAAGKESQCGKLAAAIRDVIDRERVKDLLAPFFAAEFTADEIEQMMRFYEGPAGKSFAAMLEAAFDPGMTRPAPRPPPPTDTAAGIEAYMQTPVARKLAGLGKKYEEEASRKVGPYLCSLLGPTGIPCPALTQWARAAALPALANIPPQGDALQAYQRDADAVRARYLLEWAGIIEEHYRKSGRYPLQDRVKGDETILVRIATREQQSFLDPAHPNFVKSIAFDDPRLTLASTKDLVADIEAVLERGIEERYDPQRAPTGAPNYFAYFVTKDGYLIWVVCRSCSGELQALTIPVGPEARSFNIGSAWFIENIPRTQSLEGLRSNREFAKLVESGPKRAGWFDELARIQAHESKK